MSSFLEKLNQQAATGNISTPKASADKSAGAADSNNSAADNAKDIKAQPVLSGEPAAGKNPVRSEAIAPSVKTGSTVYTAPASVNQNTGIRSTEHEIEIDKSYGTKHFLRIVATVLIFVILIAAGVVAFRYFTMVTLPDFTGKTIAEMRKWCIDNNLYLTENSVYSMDVNENYVISQSEPGGTKLYPRTTIEASFSLGADPNTKIAVPDLMNMTAPDIREWMDENKLTNVYIYEEYSSNLEKGSVTRFLFNSVTVDESNFRRSDSLTVYVSRGPSVSYNAREVKNFSGALKSEVDSWCSANGMTAVYTSIMSDSVGENRIISQSVAAGAMLDPGAVIEFVLSEGAGLVVPDFSNVMKEDASSYAVDFSVTVKLVYNMTVRYGGFISQSVASGTRVHKSNNNVTVIYSIGKPYLPNFVGMNEADIPRTIYDINRNGAHMSYMITYVTSSITKGTVVEASHGQEYVELDTLIELKISNGLGIVNPGTGEQITYVIVPDYSSVLKENAISVSRDIAVVIQMNYSDTVPFGKLISQSVKAGSAVTTDNNQVTLIYSAGKPYIDDLTGRNESELPTIFYEYTKMGANVTYVITYVDSAQPKGTVTAVSKSNEYISTNEIIQIQVSRG